MFPEVNSVESDAQLPRSVDVVVIGGGIVGVSTAYHLAAQGNTVALVEKGVIAGEQSGRNWGWVRQQNRDEREIPLIRRSLEMWGDLSKDIGVDSSFRRTGLIYVTKDPAELAAWERWVNLAKEYQVRSSVLTFAEAQALTPGATEQWIGGVHCPTDGVAEPSIANAAIAEGIRRNGGTIHQNCAVRALELTAGAVSGVITEAGPIRASAVLCAAGAWTSMFCRWHGVNLPQAGVRSSALSTMPMPQFTPGGLSAPGFTARRRLDGGYTVSVRNRGQVELTPQGIRYARDFLPLFWMNRGAKIPIRLGRSFIEGPGAWTSWKADGISPFERIRILNPPPLDDVVSDAVAALKKTYPDLGHIPINQAWGGWIDHSPDGVPVISPIDAIPGFFVATGFSGHGFGIGPAAGRLAADLVTGRTPIVDPKPFRYARLVDGAERMKPAAM